MKRLALAIFFAVFSSISGAERPASVTSSGTLELLAKEGPGEFIEESSGKALESSEWQALASDCVLNHTVISANVVVKRQVFRFDQGTWQQAHTIEHQIRFDSRREPSLVYQQSIFPDAVTKFFRGPERTEYTEEFSGNDAPPTFLINSPDWLPDSSRAYLFPLRLAHLVPHYLLDRSHDYSNWANSALDASLAAKANNDQIILYAKSQKNGFEMFTVHTIALLPSPRYTGNRTWIYDGSEWKLKTAMSVEYGGDGLVWYPTRVKSLLLRSRDKERPDMLSFGTAEVQELLWTDVNVPWADPMSPLQTEIFEPGVIVHHYPANAE